MVISLCDRVESIVGKGDNAGFQHLLLFPQCFQKPCFSIKVGMCGKGLEVHGWTHTCMTDIMP